MIHLLMLLLATHLALYAGPQEEAFLQACVDYSGGEYQKAFDAYRAIEPKNSAVWYNLGNCAYHLKNYEQAYIYWQKARHGWNTIPSNYVDHNVQTCWQKLDCHPQPKLASFWHDVYTTLTAIPVGIVQIAFLLLWYVLLFCLYHRKKNFYLGYVLLSIGVLFLALVVYQAYETDISLKGIVRAKGANLYTGPDERYHGVTELPHLNVVQVCQKLDNWYKISTDSAVGWAKADTIELL